MVYVKLDGNYKTYLILHACFGIICLKPPSCNIEDGRFSIFRNTHMDFEFSENLVAW